MEHVEAGGVFFGLSPDGKKKKGILECGTTGLEGKNRL
jgi:hypothetical protein